MTTQTRDRLVWGGERHEVLGCRGETARLFDPLKLGIMPQVGVNTALWRGYLLVFGVCEGALVVHDVHINLVRGDEAREIAGRRARRVVYAEAVGDDKWCTHKFEGVDVRQAFFTGSVYGMRGGGGGAAWMCEALVELEFEGGRLVHTHDYSQACEALREELLGGDEGRDEAALERMQRRFEAMLGWTKQ